MKYPNIKAARLSHAQIASAFKYKSVNSFRGSTAHKTMMRGVETILHLQFFNSLQDNKKQNPWDDMPDQKRQWLADRGFNQSSDEFKPDGKPCKVDVIKLQLNQIK